jgi:hypothetical protein
MNRAAYALASILAFVVGTYGQDAGIPAPSLPFVNNAPDYATWRVMYASKQAPAGANVSAVNSHPDQADQAPMLLEVRVAKAKADRQDIFVWSDKQTTEHWIYQGLYLFNRLGASDVVVLPPNPGNQAIAALFPDYSSSDFPELSWLTLPNYKGVVNYSQRNCYLFQTAKNHEGLMKQAWIDVKTKFPVAVDDGTTTMTYTDFQEISTRDLRLPSSFAEALRAFKKDYLTANGHSWESERIKAVK